MYNSFIYSYTVRKTETIYFMDLILNDFAFLSECQHVVSGRKGFYPERRVAKSKVIKVKNPTQTSQPHMLAKEKHV